MLDVVHRYGAPVRWAGTVYRASVYGERQDAGTWYGYLAFTPIGGGRSVVTSRETTQSTLDALRYWAGGISPVYLEGALERAITLQPAVQLERRLADIERLEADARAEATNLERAAAAARAVAALTERQREETARALATARAEAAEEAATLHEAAATRARADASSARSRARGGVPGAPTRSRRAGRGALRSS